jgi:hypothetical protein
MDRKITEAKRDHSGDLEIEARKIAEMMRSGELPKENVEFAAFLGSEPAKLIVPEEDLPSISFRSYKSLEDLDKGHPDIQEFFEVIHQQFGPQAYASLLLEPVKEFKPLYTEFLQSENQEPQDNLDKAIMLGQRFLSGEELAQEEVRRVLESTSAEHIQFIGNQEFGIDSFYGVHPLLSAINLLRFISTNEPSYRHFTLETQAFSRHKRRISSNLLRKLPDLLIEAISSTQNDDIWNRAGAEQSDAVDAMILKIMKKGGLEWALKDVKK